MLNGNGADVAKHCVPAVPTKRYNSGGSIKHLYLLNVILIQPNLPLFLSLLGYQLHLEE